ncbi:MAG: hypothetical protein RL545_277 [Actinomycetota bacterium]|jgi:hypothetical protein
MGDEQFDWQKFVDESAKVQNMRLQMEQTELLRNIATGTNPNQVAEERRERQLAKMAKKVGIERSENAVEFDRRVKKLMVRQLVVGVVILAIFSAVLLFLNKPTQTVSESSGTVDGSTDTSPVTTDTSGDSVATKWLATLKECKFKVSKLTRTSDYIANYKSNAKPAVGQFDINFSSGTADLNFPKAKNSQVDCVTQSLYGMSASDVARYDVADAGNGYSIWHGLSSGPPVYTITWQK